MMPHSDRNWAEYQPIMRQRNSSAGLTGLPETGILSRPSLVEMSTFAELGCQAWLELSSGGLNERASRLAFSSSIAYHQEWEVRLCPNN